MPLAHTVEELWLDNGMRGLLIDTPGATSVYYGVCFRAGTGYVTDQAKSQTAHIMEHLAFGANKKFPSAEAFSQEYRKNGAYYNANTSKITMVYESGAPLMEWDRILDLQALTVTQPRYLQVALDAEKSNVTEELTGYANNHRRVLWQEMMRSVGLRRWFDVDELRTVPGVTLDDVRAHYAHTHTAHNMRFIFAGHLGPHRDEIIKKLSAWQLPAGKELQLPTDTARSPQQPVCLVRKDLPNLTFSISFFINRELTNEELRAMGVACYALTDTMHSRIFGKARAKGICYGMGSDFTTSATGVSEYTIGGQVSLANAKELFALIIKELQAIREQGITADELQQAKDFRLGTLQMTNETVRALVGWYAQEYYQTGRIDPVDAMPERIARTTAQDVKAILNEFLDTGIWVFGGVGNIAPELIGEYSAMFEQALPKAVQ